MKVTYYGHSSFGVEIAGKHLLFDPFISPNPLASSIKLDSIKADYILVSHAHQDHLADVPYLIERTEAALVASHEIGVYFYSRGIKSMHRMNVGGSITVDGITIKAVNAIHSSSFEDGTYGGIAMGYVVTAKEGSFYFAGDTALTYDMKFIGENGNLKFAILPIGDVYTMGIDDAIKACEFIKCNNILGMHYDTFEPIKINKDEATKKFEKAGKKLSLLAIGETREF
ncbi:MAG TPA: metal-dependent hydrolase [Bacteroidia bacterium]|jgi:L-ascorbate metabolism protein UlaG (beta-lactamase superfamily)|nr:metal-dependent hydrolase [Bacteroidia bacterium]